MDRYDDNKLHEFRQLKDHIRGSKDYLVVGIDIAKDRHNAFFGMPTGRSLLRRLAFDNNKDGFEKLLFQCALGTPFTSSVSCFFSSLSEQ